MGSTKTSNKIVHLIKHIKPLKTILVLNRPKEESGTCLWEKYYTKFKNKENTKLAFVQKLCSKVL
jgi:hypothetical protein